MARIQLRDTKLFLQDGLAANDAAIATDNQQSPALSGGETTITFATQANLNTETTDQVPIGARLRLPTDDQTYTVSARTPSTGTTTSVTIEPAVTAAESDLADITWLPQRLEIQVGEGEISWSETREYIYDRDRDLLDTVRQGQDQPMSVDIAFTFEYVTASTSAAAPTPVDAIKRTGLASEWVSSDADPCAPYAVDVVVQHCVPCGADEDQEITLPDFRFESLDYSVNDAAISVSGQCNATDALTVRSTNEDCA